MNRELILLSPYRVPAQNSLSVSDEDAAAFLNGYSALWHPALLAGATSPPRVASQYDYENPTAGHVYAVPESPPLMLPDDWDQRVQSAGAVAFRATPDREKTLENLFAALGQRADAKPASDGPSESIGIEAILKSADPGPFFGIGLGFLMVNALFEAMEHDNLLAANDLWQDVQQALEKLKAGDADAYRQNLQSAAEKLVYGREVLYPSAVYIIDLCLLAELPDGKLPTAFDREMPVNVIAPVAALEKLSKEQIATLRDRFRDDRLELVTGCYVEREDALMPVESQMWNLLKGSRAFQQLFEGDVRVFGRARFDAHPQLPGYLNSAGINRAILLAFDNGVLPSHRSAVVNWPSPDGKQVETFTRTPYPADSPQTFLHLAHHLHKTIRQDMAATIALVHRGKPAAPWYADWLELTRLAPALGQWFALSRFFTEAQSSEYASASSADDFHSDYLEERTVAKAEAPVGWFARQIRTRRRIDTAWTLAGIHRGLLGKADSLNVASRLGALEDRLETAITGDAEKELAAIQDEITQAVASRLVSRATQDRPGYLLLNPCSFTRRVGLELDDIKSPLAIDGPIKACQIDSGKARLVVEVPPLGFAWFPKAGPPGTPVMKEKTKLADERGVRNEFFDADVDPRTGGLLAIRDYRLRTNRLGQILVFNPGSRMRADKVEVTISGPALGEVVTSGTIRSEQDQVLARFRQRFRAWLGRPVLELRIEITPEHKPEGYPWHHYYGARFNWGDERILLLRGVNGMGYISTHTRPETPDYLELRLGNQRTTIFPGGLPFHQRQGTRMLDMILVPEGEQTTTFDMAIALDRDYPMHIGQSMVTPVPLVSTAKGPPHVGAAGWLFHVDAPNLLLTAMRPDAEGADAVTCRFMEVANQTMQAEFRCVRNPVRAAHVDARGNSTMECTINGDAVSFEPQACDVAQLRVAFTE